MNRLTSASDLLVHLNCRLALLQARPRMLVLGRARNAH
jgi:hypothetical protein